MPKLVRDKIPEVIAKKENRQPRTRIANTEIEFGRFLNMKLLEVTVEFMNADDLDGRIEKMAGIHEVLDAFCDFYRINKGAVAEKQRRKGEEKGQFRKRIILME